MARDRKRSFQWRLDLCNRRRGRRSPVFTNGGDMSDAIERAPVDQLTTATNRLATLQIGSQTADQSFCVGLWPVSIFYSILTAYRLQMLLLFSLCFDLHLSQNLGGFFFVCISCPDFLRRFCLRLTSRNSYCCLWILLLFTLHLAVSTLCFACLVLSCQLAPYYAVDWKWNVFIYNHKRTGPSKKEQKGLDNKQCCRFQYGTEPLPPLTAAAVHS